jgi:type VI protein secretion system component Hcp
MAIVGFVQLPNVKGESQSRHRDEIEIHGVGWPVQQAAGAVGFGGSTGRAEIGPLSALKPHDRSPPDLALAAMTGTACPEIRLTFEAPGERHFDYLVIRLKDGRVTGYEFMAPDDAGARPRAERIPERIAFGFGRIGIVYPEQAADGSSGALHKVRHDLVRGR